MHVLRTATLYLSLVALSARAFDLQQIKVLQYSLSCCDNFAAETAGCLNLPEAEQEHCICESYVPTDLLTYSRFPCPPSVS